MMNYIYTLIPIALIGFAAVQGSKWNFNAATYMDKKYTNAVKGMMCVVIMYVHISNDYTNTVQNIIGSFAYVGVFTFFAISAFGCRTSVERSQSYLNQFWKKRILALFVPAILINIISFGFKVMSLNVYEVRGLYAFNQYIYGQYTKELWIDRRENSKSLAWSSVLLALGNIKKVGEVVERPKALGDIRGVTYIYGMFYRFGLINVPDEAKEKMKKAFGKSF